MPSRRAEEFARELPRLRAEFQTSRQVASRARERALAAAETTRAMRTLLDAYAETSREDRSRTGADVWRAAAKEIVRATKERDRMLGLLSHELRQSLSAALFERGHRPRSALRRHAAASGSAGGVTPVVHSAHGCQRRAGRIRAHSRTPAAGPRLRFHGI